MTRRRRRLRLGPQMLAVLRHVAANPGCTRREMAEAVAPDRPSSAHKAVQSLAQRGLLHVSLPPSTGGLRTPTDQQVLSLTVAGEAALAAAEES